MLIRVYRELRDMNRRVRRMTLNCVLIVLASLATATYAGPESLFTPFQGVLLSVGVLLTLLAAYHAGVVDGMRKAEAIRREIQRWEEFDDRSSQPGQPRKLLFHAIRELLAKEPRLTAVRQEVLRGKTLMAYRFNEHWRTDPSDMLRMLKKSVGTKHPASFLNRCLANAKVWK